MLELGEGFGGEVSTPFTGFPTGGAQSPPSMGSSKFDGQGLNGYMGGAWGA